jgi:hypothetical protein
MQMKNNLVAKHARKINKAVAFVDRKKESKRGAIKHQGKWS